MNKYQQVLIRNVRVQLDQWLHENKKISQIELYRFLHSIKGTGATIGLQTASELAAKLMGSLNEEEERYWTKRELQRFLFPLISVFYYEDYLDDETDVHADEKKKDSLVLLIDDRPEVIMSVKEVMELSESVVMAATNPERAFSSFYELTPHCVMVGAHLQNEPGWQYLHELHQHAEKRLVPQIIMASKETTEERMTAYREGADDFLQPSMLNEELSLRIRNQVQKKQRTDQYLLIDELTGVYNRKHLLASYRRMISELERKKTPFSMAILDIDHFKKINDTYGHAIGDEVLETLGAFLKKSVRPGDVVIRYGGEEFLLLLSHADQASADQLMHRLLHDFSRIEFEHSSELFHCTFSAGVMEIKEPDMEMKEAFLHVDQSLYEAKRNGRNQIKSGRVSNTSGKKQMKVAIVDDDPIIRTILSELLQKSSMYELYEMEIRSFKDGKGFMGSGWLDEKMPYLVILDGMMPEMDGLEVLQSLRKRPDEKKYTVMMLTSRNSEKDIAKGIRLGADDYVTKPFKPAELETRLSYLVKRMQ